MLTEALSAAYATCEASNCDLPAADDELTLIRVLNEALVAKYEAVKLLKSVVVLILGAIK